MSDKKKIEWRVRLSCVDMKTLAATAEHHLNTGGEIIAFDTETTGTKPTKDRIVSLCAMRFKKDADGSLKVTERLDLLINPEIHIPEGASAVNGITDETVADAPTEAEAFPQIFGFFGDTPWLCGFNSVNFDEKLMVKLYERNGHTFAPAFHLDVMHMAKEKLDQKKYTLGATALETGYQIGINFHDAGSDVEATIRILEYLMPEYRYRDTQVYEKCNYWKNPERKKGLRYVCFGHKSCYLYVSTYPYTVTVYDAYRREWRSDTMIDLKKLREQVLKSEDAETEKDLLKRFEQEEKDSAS